MKKLLLFEFTSFLFQKKLLKLTFFTVFGLLTAQTSFAQEWKIVGNENQISSDASSYTSITILNEVPYVVFREGTSPVVKVKKRNTTAGVWEQVGDGIGSNLTYTRIYIDKTSNILVTYVDAANGNKLAVKKYNFTSQIWEPLNGVSDNLYVSTGSVTNGVTNTVQHLEVRWHSIQTTNPISPL
ncbi:hypothetical protein ACM55G_07385 [Flavobacterium sp. LB3P122]|uniref:hypothetical protein n=1 Tax=Flavobacterium algoriphilum TaxID=3398738 RepID=UPI003A8AFE2F